jgi:hypothetical protein
VGGYVYGVYRHSTPYSISSINLKKEKDVLIGLHTYLDVYIDLGQWSIGIELFQNELVVEDIVVTTRYSIKLLCFGVSIFRF